MLSYEKALVYELDSNPRTAHRKVIEALTDKIAGLGARTELYIKGRLHYTDDNPNRFIYVESLVETWIGREALVGVAIVSADLDDQISMGISEPFSEVKFEEQKVFVTGRHIN